MGLLPCVFAWEKVAGRPDEGPLLAICDNPAHKGEGGMCRFRLATFRCRWPTAYMVDLVRKTT